jgi:hypothetical protein
MRHNWRVDQHGLLVTFIGGFAGPIDGWKPCLCLCQEKLVALMVLEAVAERFGGDSGLEQQQPREQPPQGLENGDGFFCIVLVEEAVLKGCCASLGMSPERRS